LFFFPAAMSIFRPRTAAAAAAAAACGCFGFSQMSPLNQVQLAGESAWTPGDIKFSLAQYFDHTALKVRAF
jgi:hypothetical protein